MDRRLQALTAWSQAQLGTQNVSVTPVAGDASFRRYFRVTPNQPDADRTSHILMDAPPSHEDCAPFLRIARYWHQHGIHVPRIEAEDTGQGFLMLEDLGDQLFLRHLNEDTADELYGAALDTLLQIQKLPAQAEECPLPPYDTTLLDREMGLFRDWFLERLLGLELSDQEHCVLDTTCAFLREAALSQPQVSVHRDYHSRNLMLLPDGRPGVIDFQDAVEGAITYDLVSLLKDCYILWPAERRNAWVERYRQQSLEAGLHRADPETFLQWFELMGMQRHLKVAGIFSRLWQRDGKAGYLQDIPLTLDYLIEASAQQPALRAFHDWLTGRIRPALARTDLKPAVTGDGAATT
ncbi:aminoglycoside phosphotransferase family protein [Mangrovitalea sediminis]|uniref:aminoglycoside phosphotransferase family protein n=1 Tax=Mangrovitalea sediminis TaxID=1982043 RepID=UPI000BE4F8FD|nr:phosphotransferase [Mangrovitalea sediminis]